MYGEENAEPNSMVKLLLWVIVLWEGNGRASPFIHAMIQFYCNGDPCDFGCWWYYHAVGSAWIGGVEQTGLAEVRGGGVGKVTVPVGLGNTNWLCVFHGADCEWLYIPWNAVDVALWLVHGWCRTKPAWGCLAMSAVPGGVSADLGVMRTELVGERLPGAGPKAWADIGFMW